MFGFIMFILLGLLSFWLYSIGKKAKYSSSEWNFWCGVVVIVATIFLVSVPISWKCSISNQADIIAFKAEIEQRPVVFNNASITHSVDGTVVSAIVHDVSVIKSLMMVDIQRVNEKILEYNMENDSWLWDWYTYDWNSPGLIKYEEK